MYLHYLKKKNCSLIGTLFTDISSSLKVNGQIGAPFPVRNGVRQGCCVAPLLYLLVHECFLKMIRNNPLIEGIPIPTAEGDFSESAHSEMRERAFADDTGVALASDASLNRLFEIADQYLLGSGSKLQVEKTVGFRFGTAKAVTPPPEHLLTWHRYGIDPVPPHHKYLGNAANALGSPDQVAAQWEAKLGELEAELDQALLSAKIPRTIFGRSLWVKNCFAAKVWYTFRFQKPSASEQSRLLTFLQRQIYRLTFGSFHFVKSSTAKHAFEDGGLWLLNPEMHLKAESAMLVKQLLCEPSGSHP